MARDDREEVRALAARALAESLRPASYHSLHPLAFHPDPEVRAQVARALGRCADPRAASLLVAATQDEVWFVRLRAVARLLAQAAHPAVTVELERRFASATTPRLRRIIRAVLRSQPA